MTFAEIWKVIHSFSKFTCEHNISLKMSQFQLSLMWKEECCWVLPNDGILIWMKKPELLQQVEKRFSFIWGLDTGQLSQFLLAPNEKIWPFAGLSHLIKGMTLLTSLGAHMIGFAVMTVMQLGNSFFLVKQIIFVNGKKHLTFEELQKRRGGWINSEY